MAQEALPNNPAANFVNELIKILISSGEDAAKAYILVTAPVLEGPILSIFTNEFISWLGSDLEKLIAARADGIVFAIQTGSEESTVKKTYDSLQAAKASGDKSAYNDALDKFAAAASALAHGDGISNNL